PRWRLGPDRGPGLAVPSFVRRCLARPAAWCPARRARAVPRAGPPAPARPAALPRARPARDARGPPRRRAPDQSGRGRGRGVAQHFEVRRRRSRAHLPRGGGGAGPARPGPGAPRRGADRGPPAGNLPVLSLAHVTHPLSAPFRISRGVRTATEVVVATIRRDGFSGRGESLPYARYGESVASVIEEASTLAQAVAGGMDGRELLELLP